MDAPWNDVFDLMWEAYRAGTIPVGAVVVDERGEIVSHGRNRIFDDPHGGQLARTRLAHAEINALAPLPPPDADTSLEDAFAQARAAPIRSGGVGWVKRSR